MHFLQSKNGNRWITEPNVSHTCKLDNYGLFSSFIEKRLCTKRFALSLCRALSFTWPAAIVIYQNAEKRNVFIKKEKKRFVGTSVWSPLYCFWTPLWRKLLRVNTAILVLKWLLTEILGVKIVYYVPAFLSIIGTENIYSFHTIAVWTILSRFASVNWRSHPFIGSSPSLMMALFLMCLIGFAGTALLAFKKSHDKQLGYTVLATGDHEWKKISQWHLLDLTSL